MTLIVDTAFISMAVNAKYDNTPKTMIIIHNLTLELNFNNLKAPIPKLNNTTKIAIAVIWKSLSVYKIFKSWY